MSTRQRGVVYVAAVTFAAAVILTGCGNTTPEECPTVPRTDVASVDPDNPDLPFRLPLDDPGLAPKQADFCEHSWPTGGMVHAAEDYHQPAGTPVYAMADGEVSFSGTMGGYGWLIIVDHPEMNLYSLYGHLSPSRWYTAPGPVGKGDLIGYLGDEWENGGSHDEPLRPHLHLGVRTGQRTDYPGRGEWRWMAGWIRPCPADLGWLPPSMVISNQDVPAGGFAGPAGGLIEKWWTETLIIALILAGGAWWMALSYRKRLPWLPFVVAVVIAGLARYFSQRGVVLVGPMYGLSAVAFLTGVLLLISGSGRRDRERDSPSTEPTEP